MRDFGKVICLFLAALLVPCFTAYGDFQHIVNGQVEIKERELYVRSGPSTSFSAIQVIRPGDAHEVVGLLDGWYVVKLEDGAIGLISGQYATLTEQKEVPFQIMDGDAALETWLPENNGGTGGKALLNEINNLRAAQGLAPFPWDEELNEIARLKALDMASNSYFGHFSLLYGTPFQMLKTQGIDYLGASENIAVNKTPEGANGDVMASIAGQANLLNPHWSKIGLGLAENRDGNWIVVQIFVQEEA